MGLFHSLYSSRTPVVGKDEAKLTGLIQSQQWPIGFGPSREIVAWDQGDEVWDGEDGDYPYPLGVFPLPCPWIECWILIWMRIILIWMRGSY